MKPGLAVICLWAALAAPAEASDPVVVLQETRTPAVGTKHRGSQHVVLLKKQGRTAAAAETEARIRTLEEKKDGA